MGESQRLSDALIEVRKAYRLIIAYQQRTIDMAKEIQRQFNYRAYEWNSEYISRGRALPTERYSLDMLPLYMGMSSLYLPLKADNNFPKVDECLLAIRFDNDTGSESHLKNGIDPDPKLFEAVEVSKSVLTLSAFGVFRDSQGKNWLWDVYHKTERPTFQTSYSWPESKVIGNSETYHIGMSFDLAEIENGDKLYKVIEDFKQFMNKKRKEFGIDETI